MSSLQVRDVLFRIYPQDHVSRGGVWHVHGLIGSGAVVVALSPDGGVAVASRKDAVNDVTKSEVRKVLKRARLAFEDLVAECIRMEHA